MTVKVGRELIGVTLPCLNPHLVKRARVRLARNDVFVVEAQELKGADMIKHRRPQHGGDPHIGALKAHDAARTLADPRKAHSMDLTAVSH